MDTPARMVPQQRAVNALKRLGGIASVFVLQPLTFAVDSGIVSDGEVNDLIRGSGNTPETMKPEGRRALRTHLAAERSPGNRAAVLRLKGYRCEACDFHFGERLGPEVVVLIEVHHTGPVGAGEYTPHLETNSPSIKHAAVESYS